MEFSNIDEKQAAVLDPSITQTVNDINQFHL